jgi:hypothetical protein
VGFKLIFTATDRRSYESLEEPELKTIRAAELRDAKIHCQGWRDQTLESLGKASAIEVVSKSSGRLELSNQRSRGWVWSSGFPAWIFVDSASLAVAYFSKIATLPRILLPSPNTSHQSHQPQRQEHPLSR